MAASPHAPFVDPQSPVFRAHEGGKLGVHATKPLRGREDLALLYTPGVAEVSLAIAADPSLSTRYTARGNTVAVISDGTAVLGLGDIGPLGAMPVMEGKAVLFKHFAGIDAVPVVHGDRHRRGAGRGDRADRAVVRRHQPRGHLGAALLRHRGAAQGAARHPGVPRRPARHRHRGAGRPAQRRPGARAPGARPAGRRLRCRRGRRGRDPAAAAGRGARHRGVRLARHHLARPPGPHRPQEPAGRVDQPARRAGPSRGGAAGRRRVRRASPAGRCPRRRWPRWRRTRWSSRSPTPTPEVHPDVARRHAAIVATGRSDFPNQINNVLAFPGIFRGALDAGAAQITEAMKLAAAHAIADLVPEPTRRLHRAVGVPGGRGGGGGRSGACARARLRPRGPSDAGVTCGRRRMVAEGTTAVRSIVRWERQSPR